MSKVSEEQITTWKKKYAEVYLISVDDKKGYFRTPDRNTLSLFLSLQERPMDANEALAKNCFLGGDKCILEEDKYFFSAVGKLS